MLINKSIKQRGNTILYYLVWFILLVGPFWFGMTAFLTKIGIDEVHKKVAEEILSGEITQQEGAYDVWGTWGVLIVFLWFPSISFFLGVCMQLVVRIVGLRIATRVISNVDNDRSPFE